MYATMSPVDFPFGQHFKTAMDTLSSLFAEQNSKSPANRMSAKLVVSRQPMSTAKLREVERLELAIRQGSINA